MTYELKHSPLRVPHDRLRVTGMKSHQTHDGEAFSATLRLDNRIIGTIQNEGAGGATWFIPGRPASAYHERMALWNAFVAGSEFSRAGITSPVNKDPNKPDAEYVADALVTEFDMNKWLTKVSAAGEGCVRSFSPSLGVSSNYITYSAPAGYKVTQDPVLVEQLEQLKTGELSEGDIWQVWTGESWKDLTTSHPTAERRP